MRSIGNLILISTYIFGFIIFKNFIPQDILENCKTNSSQNVITAMANDVSDAIGMDDFFYKISNGL